MKYTWITNEVVMFTIDGTKVKGESAETILAIFNGTNSTKEIKLSEGERVACVDAEDASAEELYTISDKVVNVPGISTMVLVEKPVALTKIPEFNTKS